MMLTNCHAWIALGAAIAFMGCGNNDADPGASPLADAATEVDANGAADAEPDQKKPSTGAPCENTDGCPGVEMVEVQWPASVGGSYFIDAHETTNGEYAKFIEAVKGGYVPPSKNGCRANTEYELNADCLAMLAQEGEQWVAADYSAVCADGCDAVAYCAWAGKRLCNVDPETYKEDEITDATRSEWYNACTLGGTTNGVAFTKDDMLGSGCFPPTVTELPGGGTIYDLEGGCREWTQPCADTTDYAKCTIVGGLLGGDVGCKSYFIYDADLGAQLGVQFASAIRCCK